MIRRFARRRSVSSCDSPGPRVPTPPPTCAVPPPPASRSRCFHMPRMRGRLYSSCASSTCSFPSAETACWAKMSRISWVRSTTRADSASSSARCCVGFSSSSTRSTSARELSVGVLQLVELALADVRPRIGARPVLHDVGDGRDARGPRELPELRRARPRRRRPCARTASSSPRSGSRLERALGIGHRHGGKYAPHPFVGRLGRRERPRRSPRPTDARARRRAVREPSRGRDPRARARARPPAVRAGLRR